MYSSNITDEYLLEHGFKPYDPLQYFDNASIIKRFPKRYDDDVGKKYFIDVKKWSNDFVPLDRRDEWWTPYAYECEVQLHTDQPDKEYDGKYLELNFHTDWNLEEVEQFVENVWQTQHMGHYEKWEAC